MTDQADGVFIAGLLAGMHREALAETMAKLLAMSTEPASNDPTEDRAQRARMEFYTDLALSHLRWAKRHERWARGMNGSEV